MKITHAVIPSHLMPSIVWWNIQAVVVTKFCKHEGKKTKTSSKFIDSINSQNVYASCLVV